MFLFLRLVLIFHNYHSTYPSPWRFFVFEFSPQSGKLFSSYPRIPPLSSLDTRKTNPKFCPFLPGFLPLSLNGIRQILPEKCSMDQSGKCFSSFPPLCVPAPPRLCSKRVSLLLAEIFFCVLLQSPPNLSIP